MAIAAAVRLVERALVTGDLQTADKATRDLRKALLKGGSDTVGMPTSLVGALLGQVEEMLARLAAAKGASQ